MHIVGRRFGDKLTVDNFCRQYISQCVLYPIGCKISGFTMKTVIAGGTLIDGFSPDPIPDGVVVLEDGNVVAAGPSKSISIPRGAEVIEADGHTVMPGIIDCHLHSTYRARDVRQHLLNTPTYNVLRSTEILAETIACGVTTARDMGGADAGFREAVGEGTILGPRLLICLIMISQTGGHSDYWVPAGMRLPKRTWLPDPIADGPDAVRALVRKVLMMGADFVKICSTGGITSFTDHWDESQFTIPELQVAVEEAARKGKKVAVHAEGLNGIKNALAAGVHSVEHGWFIDEECVDKMIENGVWWVPTLALVPESVKKRAEDAGWGGQQLANEDEKDQQILTKMKQHVPLWQDAVKRGLNVAFGTDQSHRLMTGDNLVELEYMVDWLGMTPMDAIISATQRASECIERPDLGMLKPGCKGDVLIVDGDPLSDITVLQDRNRLRMIIKDGAPVIDKMRQPPIGTPIEKRRTK